tara:strand:+ start:4189 stop:5766 length:1578 start_codon:yes stop_codon:yes gene_type:complete
MAMEQMKFSKKGITCLMVSLFVLSIAPFTAQATHTGNNQAVNPIDFGASNGAQFLDVLNLSGTSSVPLRNASWSVVNISGQTPTTLLNGPFLTSVQPVSEGQFSWNLVVDVPGIECTCFVDISIDDATVEPISSRLIVYLGINHHRPVFIHELDFLPGPELSMMSEGDGHVAILASELNITYDLISPPTSGTIVSVSALVCPAPFGVCTVSPVEVDIPFTFDHAGLHLTINPDSLQLDEGLWQFDFTAKDSLLRTTGGMRTVFLHDTQPPTVSLSLDATVNERESLNVYASLDDGYNGATYIMTWAIESENGERRAPTSDEFMSDDHILLNLTEQGVYTVHLSVRDRGGYFAQASESFTVLNLRPTAQITIDGMILDDLGKLTFEMEDGWELNASQSFDNENVDYLWVINDDRSVRGTSSLASDQLSEPGLHRIELIVFDDDGATHSTVVELEILSATTTNDQQVPFIALIFLVGIIASVLVLRSRKAPSLDLPKWSSSKSPSHVQTMDFSQRTDATIEEDEPRG